MTDQETASMGQGRTVAWAEAITPQHPHDLASIENVLLINDRVNLGRLGHKVKHRFWGEFLFQFSALFFGPPLANSIVFTSGGYWGTSHEFAAWWAYPTAAVVSCIGILALAVFYLWWRRQRVRYRNKVATIFCVLYSVSTALGLWAAYRLAPLYDGSIDWFVAPMWVLLVLSIASAIYMFRSPANPAWDTLFGKEDRRLRVHKIHPEDRAWMLEERDRAIRVLAERDLLESDATPDELALRPLGELHLPLPAQNSPGVGREGSPR